MKDEFKIKTVRFLIVTLFLSISINSFSNNLTVYPDSLQKANKRSSKHSNNISLQPDSIQLRNDSIDGKGLIIYHSFHIDSLKLSNKILSWRLESLTGQIRYERVDTLPDNFEQFYPNLRKHISNTWLGYSGSASISNDYFSRDLGDRFLFSVPYTDYLHRPDRTNFYDVKRPFTLFGYTTAGQKSFAEQTLNLLHTQNINKNLNLGFNFDVISFKGIYAYLNNDKQTKNSKFSLFGSYIRNNYALHALANVNRINVKEYGGIQDDALLDTERDQPQNIPGKLSSSHSVNRENQFFINQRYRMTYSKKIMINDSIEGIEKLPYLEFGHSLSYRRNYRLYDESAVNASYYENNYISNSVTSDSVYYDQLKNSLSVSYPGIESQKFKATILGIYTNYIDQYYYFHPDDYLYPNQGNVQVNQSLSGLLEARHVSGWLLKAKAEYYFGGYYGGDLEIEARLEGRFKFLGKSNNKIYAEGNFSNAHATFFMNEYYSNHFKWENDFSPERKTRIKGGVEITKTGTSIEFANGLHYNYLYFNQESLPTQADQFLNVSRLRLVQNIKLGNFHLDTKLQYQLISDTSLLSLPKISLFSKLYFAHEIFFASTQGRMYLQLGIEGQYDTKYYAMAYMPAIGQFYQQREQLLGNYPWLDAYANVRIKRMRIFFKYEHLTQYMVPATYFSALHYPRNPRVFKLGISWSFYN